MVSKKFFKKNGKTEYQIKSLGVPVNLLPNHLPKTIKSARERGHGANVRASTALAPHKVGVDVVALVMQTMAVRGRQLATTAGRGRRGHGRDY